MVLLTPILTMLSGICTLEKSALVDHGLPWSTMVDLGRPWSTMVRSHFGSSLNIYWLEASPPCCKTSRSGRALLAPPFDKVFVPCAHTGPCHGSLRKTKCKGRSPNCRGLSRRRRKLRPRRSLPARRRSWAMRRQGLPGHGLLLGHGNAACSTLRRTLLVTGAAHRNPLVWWRRRILGSSRNSNHRGRRQWMSRWRRSRWRWAKT